jgi:hypothetical protein
MFDLEFYSGAGLIMCQIGGIQQGDVLMPPERLQAYGF